MKEYGGSTLRLSPREAALLTVLIDSCDCVLSRDDEMIARVCGPSRRQVV
jgi:DNA-binding winged helix-turn-helix (wHTH) protein